ncbi:MAG: glycosyltransferase [Candidatus Omnitrophica bacterium]|nr:glycosyltransferase [Candidatus Omnitrophota bacterium]MBU1047716.1 glycosyltransferase [Candidatus Omnitrophota bacterium]MBU1888554.1 glycosyltransferase [Candidatus Omnitrophota bacterium]
MQKIMFIISSLGIGGVEKIVINILKNLDENKFSPTLVLLASDTTLQGELPDNISIIKLGIEGHFATLRLILPLARIIQREKPQTIVSFMWGINLIVLLTKFFICSSVKIILSERIHLGKDIPNYKFSFLRRFLVKKFYPQSGAIIAISSGIKQNLIDEFGIPEEKIRVIHNGIDLGNIETLAKALFQPTFKEYIIAVGRLEKQKNYSLLLKVFAKVNKKHDIGLVILGEGKERKNLKILIRELGLDGKVLMPGVVDNPYSWLAHGKVFVLCSKYEGFGNVIIEAMACKIPVVATNCPSGPGEIINDGVTGLLVENNNVEKLEVAILKFLNNPSLVKEISEKAFAEVKQWDIKQVTKDYETVIQSI